MGEEGGSVTLLCLTASSGVPLFCRTTGAPSKHQLPFSVIGSLNGVHMFGANLDVLLTAACTANTHVVWRVFHNSITLIVLSAEEGASDFALGRLLDNTFSAMVLILGLEELVNIRNIERLKKDLRACYKLIDSFLAPLERSGDLTQCVECVPVPHGAALQEGLEAFVAAAESRFGCLVVGGRLALATEPWWQLAPQELLLLSWLVGSLPPPTARDYPIYLPHGSPTVPHRLLTCQLLPGLEVCLICGPSPALHTVETELVPRFWKPLLEPLQACVRPQPHGLPPGTTLPPGVLAFLLIHREQRSSQSSVQPPGSGGEGLSPRRRARALRHFYALVAARYFPWEGSPAPPQEPFQAGFPHRARHCYVVSATHKAYAIHAPQHQLFLLLAPHVPTFALRPLAARALQRLTGDAAC
ncbi:protein fuzzy homolog isoform X1 [Mauremys mutica]|uniref:protein fuzzy homolog isoform X1 n=1 Tax=Mauremys mutica TaxID=74926 RepID=UPI001D16E428|nr:protein fuzzy homolog isoform X1 [Mauremys mutica]